MVFLKQHCDDRKFEGLRGRILESKFWKIRLYWNITNNEQERRCHEFQRPAPMSQAGSSLERSYSLVLFT